MQRIFMKIVDFFQLIGLNILVRIRNLIEFVYVACSYYSNIQFMKVDLSLLASYLFQNPFAISKRFLMQKGAEDVYAYGETPLTTLDKISQKCRLTKKDVVFELGCGRGRTCFWLNCLIGCKVIGIEQIPVFVEKAEAVRKRFHLDGMEFRQADILESSLNSATVIYLYGTCFEEEFIQALINKIKILPSGTKIITISYSLTEYSSEGIFEVLSRFPGEFTWGTADVYLQIKK